jgi:very-short-patch-repair endonuclease
MNIFVCKHCNNPSRKETLNSLLNHERLCKNNPNRQVSNFVTYKVEAWNKGKTVKTNPELADKLTAGGRKLAEKVESGWKPLRSREDFWTEKRRKEKSEWRKQLHIDHPETHPNRRLAGNRNKMTYPEKVAFDFLTTYNVVFEHQQKIDKYFVDFCVGKIIIEIDGARWHNTSKDLERDTYLESLGYKVFRIDSKERIEVRIREILGV